jgi:hypothetical protein
MEGDSDMKIAGAFQEAAWDISDFYKGIACSI